MGQNHKYGPYFETINKIVLNYAKSNELIQREPTFLFSLCKITLALKMLKGS